MAAARLAYLPTRRHAAYVSATFACPHCAASYPLRPVLVGKVVRCSSCKKPFQLRPDGIADKVPEAEPRPVPTTASQSAAPPSAPAPKVEPPPPVRQAATTAMTVIAAQAAAPSRPAVTRSAVITAPPPAAPPAEAPTLILDDPSSTSRPAQPAPASTTAPARGVSSNAKLTPQQDAARRAMAASLQESMAKALESDAVKQEERKAEGDAKSGRSTSKFLKAKGGKTGKSGVRGASDQPVTAVVLTGEGEREAQEQSRFWLVAAGIVIVLLALIYLVTMRSSERKALDAWSAPVAEALNKYPFKTQVIRERAWLPTLPDLGPPEPFVDMDDVSFASVIVVPGAALADALALIAGLEYQGDLHLWCESAKASAVRSLTASTKPADLLAKATAQKLKLVTHEQLGAALERASVNTEVRPLLEAFLCGGPVNPWLAQLRSDGPPKELRFLSFSGRAGTRLVDEGRPPFKFKKGAYNGTLLKITGPGWPADWKVLTLRAKGE